MEIKWRGKKLSLYRRVPKRYETIETRRFVWLSLDTDSMTEAERKEGPTWEQFVAGWEAKPAGDPSVVGTTVNTTWLSGPRRS